MIFLIIFIIIQITQIIYPNNPDIILDIIILTYNYLGYSDTFIYSDYDDISPLAVCIRIFAIRSDDFPSTL